MIYLCEQCARDGQNEPQGYLPATGFVKFGDCSACDNRDVPVGAFAKEPAQAAPYKPIPLQEANDRIRAAVAQMNADKQQRRESQRSTDAPPAR